MSAILLVLGHTAHTRKPLPPNHHNSASRLYDYLELESPSGIKGPLQIFDGLSANMMQNMLADTEVMGQHFPGVSLRHKRSGNKLIVAEVGNMAADPHFEGRMRRPVYAL